jgi:hypothetical protein
MRRYSSLFDRLFNCLVVYSTPAGRRVNVSIRVIAPSADLAMELAEKIVRADKRRAILSVEYAKAIQQ